MIRPTLKVIHAQAVSNLGEDAPSFITIKRLSASGALDGLSGSAISDLLREKYAHRNAPVLTQMKPIAVKIEDLEPERGNPSTAESLDSFILQRLGYLESKLEAATKQIETMGSAVNQLNAVKNALMSKYDALSSQRLETIEDLKGQIKKLNADSILSMEVGRMRGQLQLILEKLARPA